MTYELALGDRAYSSWSLRSWLLFEEFGLPVRPRFAPLYTDDFRALLADFFPARTVPALRCPDGATLWDSLAIAEELAARHPDAGLWPADPVARAIARSLAAEMHSGFAALRSECPMNLRVAYKSFPVSAAVLDDLSRIEAIWQGAERHAGAGSWLLGSYSVADAFYAPVAARIAGYGLPVGSHAQSYVSTHLADPAFRRWRAMALVDGPDQPTYAMDSPTRPWPGPERRTAQTIETGTPENTACPYSGKPVTALLETDGRVFGFCNNFCRDKTAADPDAWPAFVALMERAC